MNKIDFDWRTLDGILQFNASKKMCADIMGVSEDVIERRIKTQYKQTFTEYKESRMGKVKVKLQQKAIESALSGNTALLIFCLKNLCGWADKIEQFNPKQASDSELLEQAEKLIKAAKSEK
jgi:hypothetical protein